jgi:CheY-like chemotaxis protein
MLLSANRAFLREFALSRDELEYRSLPMLTGVAGWTEQLSAHTPLRVTTPRHTIHVTPLQRWDAAETEWSAVFERAEPAAAAEVPAAPTKEDPEWERNRAAVEFGQRLAGRVTHETNNLIMIAAGYGREILAGLPDDSPLRSDVNLLLEATARIEEMASQLSDYSRPAQKRSIECSIRDVLPLTGYRITAPVPEGRLSTDPEAIRWAWSALAELAGETLDLDVSVEGESAMLAVKSMPFSMEGLLERLEPLNRAAREQQRGARNAALIGSRLIQSGARWRVTEPSRFEVRIPLFTGASEPERKMVLVVDDQPGIRTLVRRLLASRGYQVQEAGSGEEALSSLQRRGDKPDLLVTDMQMPGMSGRDLAERLRQRYPQVRILFMSGYTDDAAVQAGILPPQSLFLPKPFQPEQFAAAVATLMA